MSRQSPTEASLRQRDSEPEGFHSGYIPPNSGLLRGSGGIARSRKRKRDALLNIPDINLTDRGRMREEVPPWDSNLEFEYSRRELLIYAELFLDADPKPPRAHPAILFFDALKRRQRHEIYTAQGTPEPHIVSGLYNRTHPNGLPWNSSEKRKLSTSGPSFYRT